MSTKRTTLNIRILTAFVLAALLVITHLGASPTANAATFSGINGKLVYGSQGGDIANYTIFTKLGSQDADAITNGEQADTAPVWSANGTKIAFERTETGSAILQDIWYMNADGTGKVAIAQDDGEDDEYPNWSPDGTKIVYQKRIDTERQIYVYNINTEETTQLTDDEDSNTSPSFSPDGSKIVYRNDSDGDNEIYVMDSDGSNQTRLTTNALQDYDPAWTPDGEKVVFTRRDGANHAIFIMNADGTNQTNLANDTDNTYIQPKPTPDGEKIVFSSDVGGSSLDVYEMGIDGSNITRIVEDDDTGDLWPSYQPLTIEPASSTPNPSISVNENGVASVDIPSLYTDSYEGIDPSSVNITSDPLSGSTSVSNSGAVTYTQSGSPEVGILDKIKDLFLPVAHAQSSTDSFAYEVCSLSSSELCSSGTVTVNLTTFSSGQLADTGVSTIPSTLIAGTALLSGVTLITARYVRNDSKY